MSKDNIIDSLARIDEDMIRGVEALRQKKKRPAWYRWGAIAACLCLILFGMHRLMPTRTPGDPGSIADTAPNGRLEDPQESQNSNIMAPEDTPGGEIPNVIVYVEEMTAEGFIGTVTDYGVTDRLELGTRLNVVIGDGTRSDVAIEDNANTHDSKTDYTGRYVVFQFYAFDPDTGTIVIDSFDIIDEEG